MRACVRTYRPGATDTATLLIDHDTNVGPVSGGSHEARDQAARDAWVVARLRRGVERNHQFPNPFGSQQRFAERAVEAEVAELALAARHRANGLCGGSINLRNVPEHTGTHMHDKNDDGCGTNNGRLVVTTQKEINDCC